MCIFLTPTFSSSLFFFAIISIKCVLNTSVLQKPSCRQLNVSLNIHRTSSQMMSWPIRTGGRVPFSEFYFSGFCRLEWQSLRNFPQPRKWKPNNPQAPRISRVDLSTCFFRLLYEVLGRSQANDKVQSSKSTMSHLGPCSITMWLFRWHR